ncbi:hypothetical protein [Thermanaerothrix sp.]|uniref:hypothetical protein n=1 Tax=Thermanaerothrix sp. TaxID=2972675 RepID=UPI002ADE2C7C|nr:hypothetical protein [Thermanaerothrix sp.]
MKRTLVLILGLLLAAGLLLAIPAAVHADGTGCGGEGCDDFGPVEGCPGGVRILSAS